MTGGESFTLFPCVLKILSQNWRKWDKLRTPDCGNDQRPDSEERYVLEHWSKPAEMTVDENQVLRKEKRKCGAMTFLAIYAYYTQLLSLMGKILYKGKDEFDPMHPILRSESVAPPILNLGAGWR